MPGPDVTPCEFWNVVEEVLNKIQEEEQKQEKKNCE